METIKRIAVIGATGSVGGAVLDVCARFPRRFRVVALAAASNRDKLLRLARTHGAETLCLTQLASFAEDGYKCLSGTAGLTELASRGDIDHIVFASSGVAAIKALQTALISGKEVSVSNKESIVAAGPWIMPAVQREGQLRPVDSEHSALWQCLRGEPELEVDRVWLTASGGPFIDFPLDELVKVLPQQALNHPVWSMGDKITVDSATLMNKGIECIEAMQLFGLRPDQVGALIHPGSQAHAAALFCDGTMKLLISPADMRLPAAAALAYPRRLELVADGQGYIPPESWSLNFSPIEQERFPCFFLAMEAARRGGAYQALLTGADESAVRAFLNGQIAFTDIYRVVAEVLSRWQGQPPSSLDEAISLVEDGRRMALDICGNRRFFS